MNSRIKYCILLDFERGRLLEKMGLTKFIDTMKEAVRTDNVKVYQRDLGAYLISGVLW